MLREDLLAIRERLIEMLREIEEKKEKSEIKNLEV